VTHNEDGGWSQLLSNENGKCPFGSVGQVTPLAMAEDFGCLDKYLSRVLGIDEYGPIIGLECLENPKTIPTETVRHIEESKPESVIKIESREDKVRREKEVLRLQR